MLARLTGKQVYYDKAKRALVELYKRRSAIGLVGSAIDVETGAWTRPHRRHHGRHRLLLRVPAQGVASSSATRTASRCGGRVSMAIDQYLADFEPDGLWYGQADMNTGRAPPRSMARSTRSFPPCWRSADDLRRAKQLQDSSFRMWNLAGIEPERLDYSNMKIVCAGLPAAAGDYRVDLLPLPLHARREIPGHGHDHYNALVKYCRTDEAYAALADVRTKKQGRLDGELLLCET